MDQTPGIHGERSLSPEGFHERRAGRAIVIDPDLRVLMIRGVDPADTDRGGFLWTPGGGVDTGEDAAGATRRELWEEVGLRVHDLGPVVLERIGEFPFDGRLIRQTEQFFHVIVDADFHPEPTHRSELEEKAIVSIEWLTPAELRNSPAPFYPWCLADLVEHIDRNGLPNTPWIEQQRLND
ncbi:MAG: NUDIX hydrolase [Acidimicrobiales bacterium]